MIFIIAPYIEAIASDDTNILASIDGHIVAVRYKNQLALAFHPELSQDNRIHSYFIDMINQKKQG